MERRQYHASYLRNRVHVAVKPFPAMHGELTGSFWVRINGRTGTGDIIVALYYRPPDQGDQVDETLYRQIETASLSQARSSWGTSTFLISVGRTAQQYIGNPGDSWNALMKTSISK